MTPMEQALVRDAVIPRIMNLTGDKLARVAEATGLDVGAYLRCHRAQMEGAKEAAHPHSEDAGRPFAVGQKDTEEDWRCSGCGAPPPFHCDCVTECAFRPGQSDLKEHINRRRSARPYPADGSDYSDLPASDRPVAVYDNEGPQLAAWSVKGDQR